MASEQLKAAAAALLISMFVFMAALIVTAKADDHRIHPVCDDNHTPRCWVPHPGEPGRLVPVNKPPVQAAISPQVREQMVPPQPPPGAGYRSPISPEVRAQMVPPMPPPGYGEDPYGYQPYQPYYGYGRPLLMFRFGPFMFVR
jgi:hypothetical protein